MFRKIETQEAGSPIERARSLRNGLIATGAASFLLGMTVSYETGSSIPVAFGVLGALAAELVASEAHDRVQSLRGNLAHQGEETTPDQIAQSS